MKKIRILYIPIFIALTFTPCLCFVALAQGEAKTPVNKTANQLENDKCLRCHSNNKFSYDNTVTSSKGKHKMEPGNVINPDLFYNSNHKNFKCTDCHSPEFQVWPHSAAVRMEAKNVCIDCHGGDEAYAKFHFEEIEKQFALSVHSTKHNEDFTCWMCHEPHSYRIIARNDSITKNIVAYDNNICLSCHNNINKYQLISDKPNPDIIDKHEWLPNQARHFQHVRCIECHARADDSLLVAHNIQPKGKAVKLCVECHSKNSILLASLYHYNRSKIKATELGFENEIILNSSYVIGANRNEYLNLVSLIILILVLAGIFTHITFRIIYKK
jgi:predicted CXXCH cytochrome family protein